jgi:hypothetical protein
MTRRSPRAGGSGQERPRLAGKEPGAYRATTMFVHFRETPYGLAMSLVENRRENGRICHEHVASLGSIETPHLLRPLSDATVHLAGAKYGIGARALSAALRGCRWTYRPVFPVTRASSLT